MIDRYLNSHFNYSTQNGLEFINVSADDEIKALTELESALIKKREEYSCRNTLIHREELSQPPNSAPPIPFNCFTRLIHKECDCSFNDIRADFLIELVTKKSKEYDNVKTNYAIFTREVLLLTKFEKLAFLEACAERVKRDLELKVDSWDRRLYTDPMTQSLPTVEIVPFLQGNFSDELCSMKPVFRDYPYFDMSKAELNQLSSNVLRLKKETNIARKNVVFDHLFAGKTDILSDVAFDKRLENIDRNLADFDYILDRCKHSKLFQDYGPKLEELNTYGIKHLIDSWSIKASDLKPVLRDWKLDILDFKDARDKWILSKVENKAKLVDFESKLSNVNLSVLSDNLEVVSKKSTEEEEKLNSKLEKEIFDSNSVEGNFGIVKRFREISNTFDKYLNFLTEVSEPVEKFSKTLDEISDSLDEILDSEVSESVSESVSEGSKSGIFGFFSEVISFFKPVFSAVCDFVSFLIHWF